MLSNIAIRSLKIEDRSYKRSDSGGLVFHVQPAASVADEMGSMDFVFDALFDVRR